MTSKQPPLVTIITISKDPGEIIKRTIDSVLNQSYAAIEYIIIDSASNAETQEILAAYQGTVSRIISEPDRGISHAFNKGIELATGEIIGMLNAGDIYLPDTVEAAVNALEGTEADFCYGDCVYHESADYAFILRGEADYHARLHYRMPVFNHPTVFVKRKAYEECGGFDEKWKICMDYELLLRFVRREKKGKYIAQVMAEMDRDGVSIGNMLGSIQEVRDISVAYGLGGVRAWLYYWVGVGKYWGGRFVERSLGCARDDKGTLDDGALSAGDDEALSAGDDGALSAGDDGALSAGDDEALSAGDDGALSAGDDGALSAGDDGALSSRPQRRDPSATLGMTGALGMTRALGMTGARGMAVRLKKLYRKWFIKGYEDGR